MIWPCRAKVPDRPNAAESPFAYSAYAGRAYDERFLSEIPADVDPCGENGEFHTFVWAGPIFAESLPLQIGRVVERDGFVFCDLMWAA